MAGLEVLDAEFKTVTGFDEIAQVPFEITTPNPNIGNALGVISSRYDDRHDVLSSPQLLHERRYDSHQLDDAFADGG
jgi:hypothetical protein